jgi:hypothetical protein
MMLEVLMIFKDDRNGGPVQQLYEKTNRTFTQFIHS